MKHYIKHSSTCDCKYIQTYEKDTDTWGSEETYTAPGGKVHNTLRCEIHQDVPFEELDEVTRVKEANAQMRMAVALQKNPKLAEISLEDLMSRASFTGEGKTREMELDLPELTENEKTAEISKIDDPKIIIPVKMK